MADTGARALLTRHEHRLGAWERARRLPAPLLREVLSRELLGYRHSRLSFSAWLERLRPELTLMIDLEGSITADGAPLPDAWVGGLGDVPTVVGVGDTYGSVDLKLQPLGAYRLLGLQLSELTGATVSLADVFGAQAVELGDRLRESVDWDARFDVLEAFLLRRVQGGPEDRGAAAALRGRSTADRARPAALGRGGRRGGLRRPVSPQPRVPAVRRDYSNRFRGPADSVRRRGRRRPLIRGDRPFSAGSAPLSRPPPACGFPRPGS